METRRDPATATTTMKCNNCSEFGVWFTEESNWEPVNEETPATVHPLLECGQCGNYQSLQ